MVASQPVPASQGLKLGEILREAFPSLARVGWLDDHQRRVLFRLAQCGTGVLGQMQFHCEHCGSVEWRPLGCQDRHCPSCGVRKTEAWAQARCAELLEVRYFHLVFTVPGELYPLFRESPEALYGLFFSAVRETLEAFSRNPKHLGGTPAYFSVLHTTNRRLGFHPHLHVVFAGAAFNEETRRLVLAKDPEFLFPARALAASFRGRFLSGFRELVEAGLIEGFHARSLNLDDPRQLRRFLTPLYGKSWQIRIDAVTGGPEHVIRYLARYTYRTAISNARLLALKDGMVTYTWRDRKTLARRKETLPILEFIKRFAQHILPKGFQRIRFYGALSPAKRRTLLPVMQAAAHRRAQLQGLATAVTPTLTPERQRPLCCSRCGREGLQPIAVLRGQWLTVLNPQAYPLPPPPIPRLSRSEAA